MGVGLRPGEADSGEGSGVQFGTPLHLCFGEVGMVWERALNDMKGGLRDVNLAEIKPILDGDEVREKARGAGR